MTEGKKFDSEKLRTELLYKDLVVELEGIAKVLTFGASKYNARNWMDLVNGFERYSAAAIRHLNARFKGEETDPESGLSHLSHALTCILFMQYLDNNSIPLETRAAKDIRVLANKKLSKLMSEEQELNVPDCHIGDEVELLSNTYNDELGLKKIVRIDAHGAAVGPFRDYEDLYFCWKELKKV